MDPIHTSFKDLMYLADPQFVATKKINCIKMLRGITGEGLRETKDFFEQEWQPMVMGKSQFRTVAVGGPPSDFGVMPEPINPRDLPPPMFLVGHVYLQRNKESVLVLGVSNVNSMYETVYTMESDGCVVHRYNRRDFGRVTGTDHNDPDPRNFVPLRNET